MFKIFPKNLVAVERFAKVRIFLIPPYHIFESENFRFPFLIVPEWNTHLEIFSRIQSIENSRQYLLLRTDILQKTVVTP